MKDVKSSFGVDKKYLIFTDGSVPESPDNSIVYHQEHLD